MTSAAFEVHGHRGARGHRPENTLAGFAYALELGVSALEFDVGITRDDVPVVFHDYVLTAHIARLNGRWIEDGPPLRSLPLAELAAYDVGRLNPASDYATKFPNQRPVDGERIPTLAGVLTNGTDTVKFNIEAKSTPEVAGLTAPPARIAACLVEAIDSTALRGRCMVQSFDWRVPLAVQKLAPAVTLGFTSVAQPWYDTLWPDKTETSPWLAGHDPKAHAGSVPRLIAALGGAVWLPYFGEVTRANLDEAHALGLRVVVWTVNDSDDMHRLIELGVDGITTDYPDRLRRVAQAQGLAVPAPAHP